MGNQEMEYKPGQLTFEGPGGALLRIKESADPSKTPRSVDKEAKWVLFVNEKQVEEAAPSGNGLRDLRSMAEGSYIIATGFDAEGVVQNACRRYKFMVDAVPHEVTVAHRECVWQVTLDGQLIDQQSHSLNDNNGCVDMKVPAAEGTYIPGKLSVSWVLKELKWSYSLTIGAVLVPASWTKAKGLQCMWFHQPSSQVPQHRMALKPKLLRQTTLVMQMWRQKAYHKVCPMIWRPKLSRQTRRQSATSALASSHQRCCSPEVS